MKDIIILFYSLFFVKKDWWAIDNSRIADRSFICFQRYNFIFRTKIKNTKKFEIFFFSTFRFEYRI